MLVSLNYVELQLISTKTAFALLQRTIYIPEMSTNYKAGHKHCEEHQRTNHNHNVQKLHKPQQQNMRRKKTNMPTSHRNLIGFIPSECYEYNVCIWIDRQICRWTDMVETVEATIHIYTVCEMRVKFKGGIPQLALGC